ncbi:MULTISPECIES: LapA family protein [Bacillus]|uniref:LapA family protein n=1 Tax=Bacillus TaxID=1386 RepID=UPI000BB8FCF8|nr:MULTISPECIES: lipopolysaccharide assembly protein LapA domain-containing protein [Bacillus]
MRAQWYILAGLIFAIIIAIFAVLNVALVEVNYLFGKAEWPLVLVILFSTLMGGVIAGTFAIYQMMKIKKENTNTPSLNYSEEEQTVVESQEK